MNVGGMKCDMLNESSSTLWHTRLGDTSKQRLERPIKNIVFKSLYFTDYDICVDSIKEKQTKSLKKGAIRSKGLLEVIHTNIYEPLTTTC